MPNTPTRIHHRYVPATFLNKYDGFPEKPTASLGKGSVEQVAYSPDGKLLAAAGGPGDGNYGGLLSTGEGLKTGDS